MEIKNITIRLNLELWKELKKYCIKHNTSMQEVVESYVKELVEIKE